MELSKSKYSMALSITPFSSIAISSSVFLMAKPKGACKLSDCHGLPFSKLYLNFPLLGNRYTIKKVVHINSSPL